MKNVILIFAAVFLLAQGGYASDEVHREPYVDVIANQYADQLLANLQRFVIEHGMEPLLVPHIEANTTFEWLFSNHTLEIILDNGIILGLSTIQRGGDCRVGYDLRLLRIDIDINVPLLHGTFDFDLTVLGFNPTGLADLQITDQEVIVGILLDLEETTVTIQNCNLPTLGKMDLHVDGLGLLGDPLANLVIDVITGLFHDRLSDFISTTICGTLSDFLVSVPPILPACAAP